LCLPVGDAANQLGTAAFEKNIFNREIHENQEPHTTISCGVTLYVVYCKLIMFTIFESENP
jgi:hypothetical protein